MNNQKITTFLWFDNQAEEAMKFYTSLFKNSRITSITRNTPSAPGPEGAVLVGSFELDGQQFTALNGGPAFKFTEAISLVISCDSQDEVDTYWAKLTENGGQTSQCGWLKDKYGLSWQVTPRILPELLQSSDRAKADRVMAAMMTMSKLDIATLQNA
jgi:predicted 3-demethylubiquinone-9 3-methyltransferase (glyoxalase superfamily)